MRRQAISVALARVMHAPWLRSRRIEAAAGQGGVALVAVMWMVAALSILAVALAGTSRADVRTAQVARAMAQAAALGDGAIQLAAVDIRTSPEPIVRRVLRHYSVDGRPIEVAIAPTSGFIDINGAPEALLRDLFLYGAGLAPEIADTLAQRVIDWQDPDPAALPLGAEDEAYEAAGVRFRTRGGPFESPEDLLQVLGMDFDIYDKIQGFVTVYGDGAGVDPLAADAGVINILAGGNRGYADKIATARDAGDPLIDLTGLAQDHVASTSGMIFRIEARIGDESGRVYARTRWIDLGSPGPGGLPWRTLRIEPVRGINTGTSTDGA